MIKTQFVITEQWLIDKGACADGKAWFMAQAEKELPKVIKALVKEKQFYWANWALTRAMTNIQRVEYACYSAKQTLRLFEKLYPNDKRPRLAIKAALAFAQNPSEVNRSAESAWKRILKYGLKLCV